MTAFHIVSSPAGALNGTSCFIEFQLYVVCERFEIPTTMPPSWKVYSPWTAWSFKMRAFVFSFSNWLKPLAQRHCVTSQETSILKYIHVKNNQTSSAKVHSVQETRVTKILWAPFRKWCEVELKCLRYCATNRKVAGSITDGVNGIFHWHNPSDRTIALESAQPLTEMSTRSISWGWKRPVHVVETTGET